jgi:fumarylacetoacetase
MHATDETHDPAVPSWIGSANAPDTSFPIQNLPLGVFRRAGTSEAFRAGVAIGDQVLDLGGCAEQSLLAGVDDLVNRACRAPRLNALMALAPEMLVGLRRAIHATLRGDAPRPRQQAVSPHVMPRREVELALPADIGDYTDFFASVHHATNVGSLFRPSNPLANNYKHVPVAYHGRASTIVVSGADIPRPHGQRSDGKQPPTFGPSRDLDYELEIGLFIGRGNPRGRPIHVDEAAEQLFGLCLLNDWSARDLQWWESQPLGPFLAKSFATTISPWVVTAAALAPFRRPAVVRPAGDPRPLPYLWSDRDQAEGLFTIDLEVEVRGETLGRTNFSTMYWTPAQMIAHHTANGCNLQPGDLLGSGTTSGPTPGSEACLLERTRNGREPITLGSGATVTFLEDGDEVVMRGRCSAPGVATIGFGECRGRVVASQY